MSLAYSLCPLQTCRTSGYPVKERVDVSMRFRGVHLSSESQATVILRIRSRVSTTKLRGIFIKFPESMIPRSGQHLLSFLQVL